MNIYYLGSSNLHPLRSLSADLRAHLRSGLSGLELAKPSSRPASVPALGDVTRNILGVKTGGGEEDEDSAYQDPNTDSLRSRPKSSARAGVGLGPPVPSVPQPGGGPRAAASPPTKLAGAGQLPASPVRNLFPDTGRTQSRSSTLVDAESLQEDKSPSFQPLPLDLSETRSQVGDDDAPGRDVPDLSAALDKKTLDDKVSDFLARLHQDSVNLSLDIPKPRPYEGGSLHLSLSNSDIDGEYSRAADTNDTTLTEGKFLRGLETSIEVLGTNLSKHEQH